MKPFPIPVRPIGPGSQIEEVPLNALPLPQAMATFAPPVPPAPEALQGRCAARATLAAIRAAAGRFARGELAAGLSERLDLTDLDEADRTLVNQVLGEGEVAAQIEGDFPVRIQESVFAGVWRVVTFDGAVAIADSVEVGPIPAVLAAAAKGGTALAPPAAIPDGVGNAPAILSELAEHARVFRPGVAAHVINLSLLPLAPEDGAFLETQLGRGSVTILSRGYGNCRITSTARPNCWRVVYYNSQDTVILDSIEVCAVPEVACAALEDLVDSHDRLGEVLDWFDEQ